MTNLIFEESIFITNKSSKEAVFKEIADALNVVGDVKNNFLEHVIEREKNYPTGMDLSLLDKDYPNIAIPHTETEFVNTTKIIPVKLSVPIEFQNMISPHNNIKVSFLFMILNHDKNKQSQLLAKIMDFINSQTKDDLLKFFALDDTKEIYNYLIKNFK